MKQELSKYSEVSFVTFLPCQTMPKTYKIKRMFMYIRNNWFFHLILIPGSLHVIFRYIRGAGKYCIAYNYDSVIICQRKSIFTGKYTAGITSIHMQQHIRNPIIWVNLKPEGIQLCATDGFYNCYSSDGFQKVKKNYLWYRMEYMLIYFNHQAEISHVVYWWRRWHACNILPHINTHIVMHETNTEFIVISHAFPTNHIW